MKPDQELEAELKEQWDYQFNYWKGTTGFEPVELIASEDISGSYEMDAMHVFRLKRGYAIVHESGCSCYSPDWASIDILENLDAVRESLKNGGGRLEKLLLTALMGK